MKYTQKILAQLLAVLLVITASVPATLVGHALETEESSENQSQSTEMVGDSETDPAEESGAEESSDTVENNAEEEDSRENDEALTQQKSVVTDETYTIQFDLSGGFFSDRNGGEDSVMVTIGQNIILPEAPEKEERCFAGWLSTRTGEIYEEDSSYVVVDDDTLTAQWNMLQVMDVDAVPQDGSAMNEAECVVAPISEADQADVETAVNHAFEGDTVEARNVLAVDISFVGESGEELQPEEEESVPVTLTVPQEYVENAAFLVAFHMVEQEDGSYFAEPVQYIACTDGEQKIQFGATGFSIYAVAAVGKKDTDAESVLVRDNGTNTVIYEMEEEQSQVFFFLDENAANYTYHRYTWTVEENDDTIRAYSTSIYFQDKDTTSDNSNNYQYPWLSVDALRPGRVTVTVNYYCYNGNSWWRPTGTVSSGTVKFTLIVTEKENGLAIENHIPENGTLKPVWRGTEANTNADHYVWNKWHFYTYNRSDGSPEAKPTKVPIDDAAILSDGSINVAIDAGGISQELDAKGNDVLSIKFYTCTAYDADGNELGTATHRVEYGEDVLNGSFEYPQIPSGTGYAFANGARQLFWKTTAPGDGSTLGQDVELGNDSAGNPYLTSGATAYEGTQYAELNAEKAGSLYQDVLTAPGAQLSWSFAHRSRRGTGVNVMYLIIAASKDAQNITNQREINALISKFDGDGVSVSHNGGTFKLWKFEGNELYWQEHSGTYKVPDGQYATRFFFVSASGSTLGNLVDDIHFNESASYVIEYYLNGARLEDLTEISNAELDSVVTPAHTGDSALQNAFLTSSTINGVNYGGTTLSIKSRATIDAEYEDYRNVLRLYYTTGMISVRKEVEIEGWEDLTDEEKSAVNGTDGYTADFQLYDGTEVVATASVKIDLIEYAHKTAVAVFMDAKDPTKAFAPAANHSYRVVESTQDAESVLSRIYKQEITYTPASQDVTEGGRIQTDGAGTGSCTVKNTYHLELTTLTIQKKGWLPIDENQTFVYRVQGMDFYTKDRVDLIVTIHGNGSTRINNLPIGSYKVTEVESWSWRYTPTENGVIVNLEEENTVTFDNTRAAVGDGDRWRWLNGGSWADNRWLDGKKLGPDGEEGGEQND